MTRLFLQFDQRFWVDSGLEGLACTDLPVSDNAPIPGFWIEEATSLQPGTPGILDCYITGQRAREFAAMGDAARVMYTLDQVERVFPGAKSHYSGRVMTKIGRRAVGARRLRMVQAGTDADAVSVARHARGPHPFCRRSHVGPSGLDARRARVRPSRGERSEH